MSHYRANPIFDLSSLHKEVEEAAGHASRDTLRVAGVLRCKGRESSANSKSPAMRRQVGVSSSGRMQSDSLGPPLA